MGTTKREGIGASQRRSGSRFRNSVGNWFSSPNQKILGVCGKLIEVRTRASTPQRYTAKRRQTTRLRGARGSPRARHDTGPADPTAFQLILITHFVGFR